MSEKTKFAHLGKPGTAFTEGFQRRLNIMKKHIDFKGKSILDLGCGEGVWLEKFTEETGSYELVYGSEYDKEQVDKLQSAYSLQPSAFNPEHVVNCPGEALAFPDNFFDIVFQNEVLEHVQDDRKTLEECYRVLKPGGLLVLFTPNRFWPFEQHGMFIGEKYYWGNIPFLPWMPEFIYKKLARHVRNYWPWSLRSKLQSSNFNVQLHSFVFPGFDGAVRRFGIVGRLVQKFFFLLEKTPLKIFGISHFIIARK
jgi:ubiquinone/menaquinone biosynthesis C-methylase UbiE